MDKLDIRILREVLQGAPAFSLSVLRPNIRLAFQTISKNLGLAEGTVRDRFNKLSEGFLAGWTFQLNPSLSGVELGAMAFEVSDTVSKQDVLDKLRLIDDILVINSYMGRFIHLLFFYTDERVRLKKTELIRKISLCKDLAYTNIPFPPVRTKVSLIDMRIVRSLQKDFRKSNREIAKEVGCSSRTVNRRLLRLIREALVFPVASLNVAAMGNSSMADLMVHFKSDEVRQKTQIAIFTLLNDNLFFAVPCPGYGIFNLIVPSVPAGKRILDQVTSLDGVKSARLDFMEERLETYDTLALQVKRKLDELERARN